MKQWYIQAYKRRRPLELKGNIEEFGLTKMKPYNLALSNTNGKEKMVDNKDNRGGNAIHADGTVEVETKTLAQFMKDEGIEHVDVLKIDIENNEELVFGSGDFSDVASKIDFIIGEHWSADVKAKLESLGFHYEPAEHGNSIFSR